ncbi:MAG: hypothetical protein ABEJ95_00330 [Candidatus Nanohalobium sp.]
MNYRKVVERETDGFFVYQDVEYRPQTFNISAYTQRTFDMKTQEVRNIYQATEKMLK